MDAEQVDAKFLLPENVRVIQGKETWSGPVRAHEDYVMWVQVQTNTAGEVYLSGWAGIKDGNPVLTPLGWGKYFVVTLESSLKSQLEYERILSTPTPTLAH